MAQDPLEPPLHFPRQMHAVDYLMFRGEHEPRSRTAMLSVSLLDTVPDLDRLRAVYDRASRVVVRMRQHVVEPVVPLTAPQWIVDPDFDLSYHVRRVRLPEPGTVRQLLDFAQPIHAAPLDTTRPLWEVYLVDGLTEGDATAALILKMHHAISDGVGGMALAGQIYDSERDADRGPLPPRPVPEDVSSRDLVRKAVRRAPISITETSCAAPVAWSASGCARAAQARSRRERRREVRRVRAARRRCAAGAAVAAVEPPRPRPPTREARVPVRPLPPRGQGRGGSVNDAYIAGLCGALGRYHQALGVPIDAVPLALPVSLRNDDDPAGRQPVRRCSHRRADRRTRSGAAHRGDPRTGAHAVAEPAINALDRGGAGVGRLPATDVDAMAALGTGVDVQASNVPGSRRRPTSPAPRCLKTLAVRAGPRRGDDGRALHRGRRVLPRCQLRHRLDHPARGLRPVPPRGLRRDPRARARATGDASPTSTPRTRRSCREQPDDAAPGLGRRGRRQPRGTDRRRVLRPRRHAHRRLLGEIPRPGAHAPPRDRPLGARAHGRRVGRSRARPGRLRGPARARRRGVEGPRAGRPRRDGRADVRQQDRTPASTPRCATSCVPTSGRATWSILSSSATSYQVEPVARYLGIDHVLCNRFETKDGLLTGNVERPVIWGPTQGRRGAEARRGPRRRPRTELLLRRRRRGPRAHAPRRSPPPDQPRQASRPSGGEPRLAGVAVHEPRRERVGRGIKAAATMGSLLPHVARCRARHRQARQDGR